MNNTIEQPKVWTVEAVRRELPDLKVIGKDDKIYVGRLLGRLNDVATIVLYRPDGNIVNHPITGGDISTQFSWATIAAVLNSKKPITFYP
jgi:hypothetical protein